MGWLFVGIGVLTVVLVVYMTWAFPLVWKTWAPWLPHDRFEAYRLRSRWNVTGPVETCVEGEQCRHKGQRPSRKDGWDYTTHKECVVCSAWTCNRSGWIDPQTLRRTVRFVCRLDERTQTQTELAQERRRQDLEKVTIPPDDSHLTYGYMPDQYPGLTRDAIRAFLSSDADEVVVDGIQAGTLNESLASTGQGDEAYAEQRGNETVLRKT